MNISDFRASMTGDGARPNLFRITINLPAALQSLSKGNAFGNKLGMTARASQIPGSTIGKVPTQYMGREVYLAGNRTFQDWTVTIINDEDFIVRRALERWMSAINSHVSNVRGAGLSGPNSYVADAIVEQLSKNGPDIVIAKYKMIATWPTDLAPIQLDWGQNDVLEEFDVTFSMDAWDDENGDLG